MQKTILCATIIGAWMSSESFMGGAATAVPEKDGQAVAMPIDPLPGVSSEAVALDTPENADSQDSGLMVTYCCQIFGGPCYESKYPCAGQDVQIDCPCPAG